MQIPGHIDPVAVPRAPTLREDGRVDLVGLSKDQIRAELEAALGQACAGRDKAAAALDLARTAARRAERQIISLPKQGRSVRPVLLQYLNRLSDLLWLLGREAEQA